MFDYSGQSPYTKQIIQQMMASGARPARNMGEGLASAGNSILGAIMAKKDEAEGQARSAAQYEAMQNAFAQDPTLKNDPLISSLISNPQLGPQIAPQVLGQVLTNRLTPESMDLPTGMRMGENGPEYIPEYLDGQMRLKQAGRTSVNTSVNTGNSGPQIGTIPQGFQLTPVSDEQGNIVSYQMAPIPGGPVDMEQQENAQRAAEAEETSQRESDVFGSAVENILRVDDEAWLPTTGAVGGALSNVGSTGARAVASHLQTLKGAAGFQRLNRMRAESPTGGALGAISKNEMDLLSNSLGVLDQELSGPEFYRALRDAHLQYNRTIHGPTYNHPQELEAKYQAKINGRSAPPARRKFNPATGRIE